MPKCGEAWKKPVSQITDRQKRYRANHPDCKPKGKKCEDCGSKKNLVIGHRDGNESNGRPYNLGTFCKSCNGIDAAADKKAGRGVRTRQYNPKFPDKIAGHEHWAQLMASKLAEKYDGLRRSGLSKEDALSETLRNTTAGPKSRELFRRIAKNPGASNLAQYVQAAVEHTRGAHDEGGKVIHETPKAKRREFAREIAFRKGYRNNPTQESAADAGYRKFHGRGPSRTNIIDVSETDPYGKHPELFQCGWLVRLIVGEGIKMVGEDGDEAEAVTDGFWSGSITFVPDIDEYHDWMEELDNKNPADIRMVENWLRRQNCPDVAGVPSWGKERTAASAPLASRQLYIVGGNQNIDSQLKPLGVDPDKDLMDLGFCYMIEYFTQKRFNQFQPINYWHHFGEETGVQPRLTYDRVHHRLQLVGGEYVVKSVGIAN